MVVRSIQKWHHDGFSDGTAESEFKKDSYIGVFEQFCWTQVYYNLEVEWLLSWMFSQGWFGEAKEIYAVL